jgi:hypothetical protein
MITWLKSLFAPAPVVPPNPNVIQFGSIDTQTGELSDGYIDANKQMCFCKTGQKTDVWHKPEAVGTWIGDQQWHSSGWFKQTERWTETLTGVTYRQKHRFTDQVRYFIGSPTCPEYIDTEAYVKFGKMVLLSNPQSS